MILMNWSWPNHPGGLEKTHEKLGTAGTSRIQRSSVNHLTMALGNKKCERGVAFNGIMVIQNSAGIRQLVPRLKAGNRDTVRMVATSAYSLSFTKGKWAETRKK
jgi:hypothetical protein